MTHIYSNLGAIPALAKASAERRDPLLARTGPAARRVLRMIKRYPTDAQARRLDQALRSVDPELPAKVRQVATKLRSGGMSTERAVERAISLSLADATISRIKRLGYAARRGEAAQQLPLGGLGSLGGDSPEEVFGRTVQGVICSQGLQQSITDLVGRNEGRDAANATGTGFAVGQGIAQCSSLTPTAPVAPPPEEDDGPSLLIPIVVGVGTITAVGAALWWMKNKS